MGIRACCELHESELEGFFKKVGHIHLVYILSMKLWELYWYLPTAVKHSVCVKVSISWHDSPPNRHQHPQFACGTIDNRRFEALK